MVAAVLVALLFIALCVQAAQARELRLSQRTIASQADTIGYQGQTIARLQDENTDQARRLVYLRASHDDAAEAIWLMLQIHPHDQYAPVMRVN
jgi:hypothetical protein